MKSIFAFVAGVVILSDSLVMGDGCESSVTIVSNEMDLESIADCKTLKELSISWTSDSPLNFDFSELQSIESKLSIDSFALAGIESLIFSSLTSVEDISLNCDVGSVASIEFPVIENIDGQVLLDGVMKCNVGPLSLAANSVLSSFDFNMTPHADSIASSSMLKGINLGSVETMRIAIDSHISIGSFDVNGGQPSPPGVYPDCATASRGERSADDLGAIIPGVNIRLRDGATMAGLKVVKVDALRDLNVEGGDAGTIDIAGGSNGLFVGGKAYYQSDASETDSEFKSGIKDTTIGTSDEVASQTSEIVTTTASNEVSNEFSTRNDISDVSETVASTTEASDETETETYDTIATEEFSGEVTTSSLDSTVSAPTTTKAATTTKKATTKKIVVQEEDDSSSSSSRRKRQTRQAEAIKWELSGIVSLTLHHVVGAEIDITKEDSVSLLINSELFAANTVTTCEFGLMDSTLDLCVCFDGSMDAEGACTAPVPKCPEEETTSEETTSNTPGIVLGTAAFENNALKKGENGNSLINGQEGSIVVTDNTGGSKKGDGTIVAVVVVVTLAIIIVLLVLVYRKKSKQSQEQAITGNFTMRKVGDRSDIESGPEENADPQDYLEPVEQARPIYVDDDGFNGMDGQQQKPEYSKVNKTKKGKNNKINRTFEEVEEEDYANVAVYDAATSDDLYEAMESSQPEYTMASSETKMYGMPRELQVNDSYDLAQPTTVATYDVADAEVTQDMPQYDVAKPNTDSMPTYDMAQSTVDSMPTYDMANPQGFGFEDDYGEIDI
eukprot:m.69252 g.69252  ORF g.69252 m.69252 type:complete len:785 (-) comp12035_c0_seq3:86-2440(-)